MKAENTTKLQFDSLSVNESYAGALRQPFLPDTTPPCRSWLTSKRQCPKR